MANKKNKNKLWGNITRRTSVLSAEGIVNKSVLNQIKWYTKLSIADIHDVIQDIYKEKQVSKAKGMGKAVRVVEVLNAIYAGRLDNFFFNMGISVDSFILQVNAQLPANQQIDRDYIADTTHWTEQPENEYQQYRGDLILPNSQQVHFDWDYDMGSSWYIA